MLRSAVISSIRRRMTESGFMEFQTPILTSTSPEGARDFLVPSRLHPGEFYALPQAPQQFKQLIMIAGFDRYFQIAPCVRDEDARADRSPGEFYQLDIEMSFVTQDDVFAAIEPVLGGVFEEFANGKPVSSAPFRRIPYDEAMLKYGTDKPDLRNPIEIADVTDVWAGTDFKIFAGAIDKGAVVRALPAPGAASRPRSFFDKLNDWARAEGAGGLGYIILGDGEGRGPIAKFLDTDRMARLREVAGVGDYRALPVLHEAEPLVQGGLVARPPGIDGIARGRGLAPAAQPGAHRFQLRRNPSTCSGSIKVSHPATSSGSCVRGPAISTTP